MKRENDTYVVSSTGLIGYPHGKCKRNLDLLFTWHKNEFYMELQVELYNEKKILDNSIEYICDFRIGKGCSLKILSIKEKYGELDY